MRKILLALVVTLCSLSAAAQTPSCTGAANKPTPACLPTSAECTASGNCIQSCSIANVCTNGQTGDDPRTFPGTVMNSDVVAPSGTSRAIHTMSDFTTALTLMSCGDELVLDDDAITGGTAFSTVHGITLPNIASGGSGWITIRSSGTTNVAFPAEHNRVFIGDNADGSASATSKANVLPLLASFAVHAVTGADFIFQLSQPSTSCHYRFIGLNFFGTGGNAPAFGNGIKGAAGSGAIVELINLSADHTVFDRSYFHGTLDDSFAVTSCSVTSNVATVFALNYASVGDPVTLSGLTGPCSFLNSTTPYTISAVDTSFQSAAITSIATGAPPTTGCTAPASTNIRATMASNPFANNTRVIINTPNGVLCTGTCNGSWTGDRTATNVTSTTFDYGSTGNCSQPNTFTGTNLTARSLGNFVTFPVTHADLSTTSTSGLAFFTKSPNILGVGTRELLSRVFNAAPTTTYMAVVDSYFDQILGPQSTDYQVWFTRPANTAETSTCNTTTPPCNDGFFKFVNNYLEGSEAIFSGGAGFNADGNAVPHDFEIRRNVFNIPIRWFYMAAAHNDRVNYNYYKIVDNWEIKTGQRGLITGNIHHGVWAWGGAGDSGQNGRLNLQGNQSGTNANVRDWTIVNNLFDGANSAITHAGGSQTCGLGGTPASPFCQQLDYEISEVQQNNLINLTGPGYSTTIIGASGTGYGADAMANTTNNDIEHQTTWTTVPSGSLIVGNGSLVFNVNGPNNINFKVLPALDNISTCVCTGGNTIQDCTQHPPTGNRGVGMGTNWSVGDTFKIDPTGPSGCPDGMTYTVKNVGSNGCMQDATQTWTATSAIASCATTAHVPVVVTHCAITGGCTGLQLYVFRGPDDVNLWYKNNVAAMRAVGDSSGIQGSAALTYMSKPSPAGANDLIHRYSGNYIYVYPNQNINTSKLSPTVNFDCGTTGTPSTYDPTVTNNSNCEIQSATYGPNPRFNFNHYDTSGGGICSTQHPCDLSLVNPYVSLDVTNTACVGTNCAGVDFNSSVGLFQAIATTQSGQQGSGVQVITTSIPNGAVGEAYSVTFQAIGGAPPYTWTSSWTLPSGVSFSAFGILSGTPGAGTSGTYNGTVTATDSLSVSSPPKAESLFVNTRLTLTAATLPTCTVGVFCSTTLPWTGGLSPFAFTVASGSMSVCPTRTNGMCLDPGNGSVSGTPVAASSQVFTAQVSDPGITNCTGANSPACQSYTLTSVNAFRYVSPTSIPTMVENVAITPINVTTSGGTGTPTCSLSSGSFPTGVSLSGCTISGTPATGTHGAYTVVLQVVDVGGTGQTVMSGSLPFSVQSGLMFTTTSCPSPVVAFTPYTCTLTATGGITPYTFSIKSGALPPGTSIVGNLITGVVNTIGTFRFTPQVADSSVPPLTDSPVNPFTVVVNPPMPIIMFDGSVVMKGGIKVKP